jgi:hypothetical protein
MGIALALALVGCSSDKSTGPVETKIERIQRVFPTSIHGARPGKATFYEAPDGFRSLTGIPIDSLACTKCHAASFADGTPVDHDTYEPGCKDCHVDPANPTSQPVTDQICLGCHGRQGAEQNLFQDVHRAAGLTCITCHSEREMHGDGRAYASFLEAGASDAACEDCHTAATAGNPYHATHLAKLDCSACHVKSVSSCYNCHFETEVIQEKKRFFAQAPRTGFKMLMNFNGKVHTATFQALTYQSQSFLAIAPFFGHSITKDDITCGDCHLQGGAGNSNVKAYDDHGKIVVTSWNAGASGSDRLVGPSGVIPVPADWKTALEFVFLNYSGAPTDPVNGAANLPLWDYLETGSDGSHIVYGSPLTSSQIQALIDY